jgi:hypothetical protein
LGMVAAGGSLNKRLLATIVAVTADRGIAVAVAVLVAAVAK